MPFRTTFSTTPVKTQQGFPASPYGNSVQSVRTYPYTSTPIIEHHHVTWYVPSSSTMRGERPLSVSTQSEPASSYSVPPTSLRSSYAPVPTAMGSSYVPSPTLHSRPPSPVELPDTYLPTSVPDDVSDESWSDTVQAEDVYAFRKEEKPELMQKLKELLKNVTDFRIQENENGTVNIELDDIVRDAHKPTIEHHIRQIKDSRGNLFVYNVKFVEFVTKTRTPLDRYDRDRIIALLKEYFSSINYSIRNESYSSFKGILFNYNIKDQELVDKFNNEYFHTQITWIPHRDNVYNSQKVNGRLV